MEATVYLFGYLHNLLLLQGLTDLYQFRGVSSHDSLVHVAGVRQSHDDVPVCLLGEHLEGLGLCHLLRHLRGTVPVGHPQQQSLLVALQVPYLQVACTRHQGPVIVVHGVAQRVVVAIDLAAGFQEFHLVLKSPFRKHADDLIRCCLGAAEGHVETYDLLHPRLDLCHILISYLLPSCVLLLEVAIVASRQRVLDEEFRAWKQILRGLVEQETQRAYIHPVTRSLAGIEELYVAVLVHPELQPLGYVVDFGGNNGIGKFDVVGKLLIHVEQRGSLGETLCHVVVLAADL